MSKYITMRLLLFLGLALLLISCGEKGARAYFTSVEIFPVLEDSLSIRAIELMPGSLAFAADKGIFGTVDLASGKVRQGVQPYDSLFPEFRSVAHTKNDFFMLSVASPALLYKTGDNGMMTLVYKESDSLVFYDAMIFWNDLEGIAIGDSMNGCLSVIITRDGGQQWKKTPCKQLPPALAGEGAFAASNTNIAVSGDQAWVATTAGRILHTADKGISWTIQETPVLHNTTSQGIYSIDFEGALLGIAFGGDYTHPEGTIGNKAFTEDGGNTWRLIADGKAPGYKSCVQFVPGSQGREIVAIGFSGISYSSDMGEHWEQLSRESYYTLRFVNDTLAYAAGKNRISKLIFR